MKMNTIKLETGQNMLVEVVEINLPKEVQSKLNPRATISDLPEGADPIGVVDDIKASMDLLKDNLKSIATTVQDAFRENQPDEFSVEVNFGFAGEGAIPFIASAKSNAGIKVKATWKRGS